MSGFKYEIIDRIAILSENGKWTKELNKVSWNEKDPKYDIRYWNHSDSKVGKGISLDEEDLKNLKEVLNMLF